MIKKNWSLLLVALILIAIPTWGRLSVLLARDQFLRLEDIVATVIDPKTPEPMHAELDEILLSQSMNQEITQTLTYDGRLYILWGEDLFQDGYSYHYTLIRAQISDEPIMEIREEDPFQMYLYGADENGILYGKHYSSQHFQLYLFNFEREESILIKSFGRLPRLPKISFHRGTTAYLQTNGVWGVLDAEGNEVDIKIDWKENTKIQYVAASPTRVFFYTEEDPLRFIVIYDRRTKTTMHIQTGDRIGAIYPMEGAALIERSVEPSRYSVAYFLEKKFDRIREGERFDYLRVISPQLIEWVQGDFYEVYNMREKRVVYATKLTPEQKRDLIDRGMIFYIPPLESVRWVRPE